MKRLKTAAFACLPVVALLVVAELLSRGIGPDLVLHGRPATDFLGTAFRSRDLGPQGYDIVADPYCGYRLAEGSDPSSRRPPRVPGVPKTPGEVRVLCLGDSTTYGFHLAEDEAWPHRLQTYLQPWAPPGVHFEVYNGGVPGYGPEQAKRLYQSRLVALNPDILLWREAVSFSDALELPPEPSLTAIRITRALYRSRLLFLGSVAYRLAKGPDRFHALVDLPMLPAADADRDVFPEFVRWARARGATSFGVVEYVTADPGDASRWLSRTPEPGSWAADGLFLVPAFGPLRARFARPADAFYDGIHFSAAGADATARAISDSLRERWPECARRMEGKRDGAR